jgi:hypothetical protein
MNPCLKSLRSLVIALGLAVFATGCFAEVDGDSDADAELLEGMPESDTLDGEDETTGTESSETGSDSESEPPPPPPPPPGGLCTGTSCTQV